MADSSPSAASEHAPAPEPEPEALQREITHKREQLALHVEQLRASVRKQLDVRQQVHAHPKLVIGMVVVATTVLTAFTWLLVDATQRARARRHRKRQRAIRFRLGS